MSRSHRFLLLEDSADDAALVRRVVMKEWPACEVAAVSDQAGFHDALAQGGFDLILCDYLVPGFGGTEALTVALERCPETPFLFVSGRIGDEVAVECLKAGATDYVLKDQLVKLVPAIRRALSESEECSRRKQTESQLRRSEAQFRELVNSVDGIVWQADLPSLRFTFVSPQAERLLGYPPQVWLAEPDFWQNHIHPDDRERAIGLCREAGQKYQSFEYRMLTADGRVVWLRDIVSRREEGTQIQGIMVNISSRIKAEEARRDIQTNLERSNKDLLHKNQEIQSFYHTLSHELKTPLTSAREFISILLDGLAGPLSDTQCEYLKIAQDSCNQLRACINDLLDATRLETGKLALEFQTVSLAGLIQRVAATMRPMAGEKNITLHQQLANELADMQLDEHRLTQVITNLLSNAIKFTPPNGSILIRAGDVLGQPELVMVSVTDTGRGIPAPEQERIFERLYQIKAGDAATGQGVGLGLYLCRELVQLHGGNIWVESQPPNGATFHFVLPKSQQSLRANVLVIDDDPDMLEMLRELLLAERYNVRTAHNGRAGLQEMRRQPPDIVLLDLAMPDLNGPAALRQIRQDWGAIPVIVHTAFSDGELMKQALAFSPFTLLAKPCAPDQILETVRKVERSGDTAVWRKNHFGLRKLQVN
jgi:PAS domain S-box-containing protein